MVSIKHMILKLLDGGFNSQPSWWKNFIRDVDIRCKLNNRVDGDHPRRNNIIRNEFSKVGANIIYERGDLDIPIALQFEDEALGTWFLLRWS